MKKILIFLAILIFAVFFIFLWPKTKAEVCFGPACFEVEVAKTESKRQVGLMFRKNMPQNKGMFFVFDREDIYPFWMKNTLMPLDIIWIDKNNKIVFIKENARPCLPAQAGQEEICPQIIPQAKAKYVLEINAGLAQNFGLKPGDFVAINFD